MYRRVLDASPRQPEALHLLGMVAYQRRDLPTAVARLTEALALRDHDAVMHQDLGTILQAQGRAVDALAQYDRALALDPALDDAKFNRGTVLASLGRHEDAAACFADIVRRDPAQADAHHRCGMALHALGRRPEAIERYGAALALAPHAVEVRYHLGNALREEGDFRAAADAYRDVLARRPQDAAARNNLGAALLGLGQRADAVAAFREAARLDPSFAGPQFNLAALLEGDAPDEAIAALRRVVRLAPDHADAHRRLGRLLLARGAGDAAAAILRRAAALAPHDADVRTELGQALQMDGQLDAAIAAYGEALARDPASVPALGNLAHALAARGDTDTALQRYREALAIERRPMLAQAFAACAASAPRVPRDDGFRALLVEALTVPWARPADLARVASDLVRETPGIAALVARASGEPQHAWQPGALTEACAELGEDALLRAALAQTPLVDARLERLLVQVRRALLTAAATGSTVGRDVRAFGALLARQCFINEYVWPATAEEEAVLHGVREGVARSLAGDGDVDPLAIVALAAYQPLDGLEGAAALTARTWPDDVAALVRLLVSEPLAEVRLRDAMPRLTPIDDPVSQAVQAQYEEHPYPRWIAVPRPALHGTLADELRQRFPRARSGALPAGAALDILIAGGGTGQEPIETALRHPDARVLAVDLSRASLAYAARSAAAHGASNIAFAQADLLALRSVEQRFDVVSSVGVLHHLADPLAGLRVLTSLLRPGGVLQIGLYSERARQGIAAAREWVASRGFGATHDDLRRARQALRDDREAPTLPLARLRDAHAASTLRDLLFHAQEQAFTLPAVGRLLDAAGLELLGFVLPPVVHAQYAARFPEDRAGVDLARWDAFEADHPDTFTGMIVFWARVRR